ncbi:MAG TPA: peptide ABC transporter substrate-binding protein [Pirellulales bacterium]|nr:peptide ABC transporter substrate-binding protein [Pirellulales bacterium]
MNYRGRTWFAGLLVLLLIAATAWALTSKPEPPADFTFVNNTEIRSIDPALALGQPEGRVIVGLFEGLTNLNAKDLHPIPGVAESWDISPDLRTYTFHFRDNAKWIDGTPVVAGDFVWQWRHMLDSLNATEYTYQHWYLENGERYTSKQFGPGDKVEVELHERPKDALPFARGIVLHGKLIQIIQAPTEKNAGSKDSEATQESDKKTADKKEPGKPSEPVYVIEIDGQQRAFQNVTERDRAKWTPPSWAKSTIKTAVEVEPSKNVLLDFSEVGVKALDNRTLQVHLKAPTPYYLQLVGFYPLFPTNPRCVETYGYPEWTKPDHVITNGPFKLESHVVRSRLRMVKNPLYWNAANVKCKIIDSLPIESSATAFNMYLDGQVDWIPLVPTTAVPDILAQKRTDFLHTPEYTCDFYRFNCTRPPLNNKLVRQALAMAVNKKQITEGVIRGGEEVARSLVPPGLPGYESPQCPEYNPERARQLLAQAGYPGGRGIPKIEILYNTDELNQNIVEVIQAQWKENLGIDVGLQNMEWNSWLSASANLQYDVCRGGWIGDYLDPNTFLDMFVTDGGNNQTGWSNKEYDKLIESAKTEHDPAQRMKYLHNAEVILMDEMPIFPIYYRVSRNMIRPYVHGFYPNLLDLHPLDTIWIDQDEKKKFLQQGGRG